MRQGALPDYRTKCSVRCHCVVAGGVGSKETVLLARLAPPADFREGATGTATRMRRENHRHIPAFATSKRLEPRRATWEEPPGNEISRRGIVVDKPRSGPLMAKKV